ncbi:right-handed parallel beta-helix repeat-containing protein [Leptolyngbya sp. FACHB-261]|uniref:right-handed parallel beta-helix repeat-containing protein n=1 Tax=Leptolyngbya sp. FACHB-261 TaxID=2692806 RepID=UPI0016874E65|nr:right-handed parallel beta-helix repeat-containing protein [Leptolyngbya sp. FACHB-261]MBD2100762.1 right-handed parallel beta-helix repeat-containing protein [Leptolyngbya sp. FACHB-261]
MSSQLLDGNTYTAQSGLTSTQGTRPLSTSLSSSPSGELAASSLVSPTSSRASSSSLGTARLTSTSPTSGDLAGNTLATAYDAGLLSNSLSFTDVVNNNDPVDYIRFSVNVSGGVSTFLNGLSAGNTIDLLDSSGNLLQTATNSGTTWTQGNSGTTGGSLSRSLAIGTYYLRVSPTALTGNPLYANTSSYTLNLVSHEAPGTVTVAASNTVNVGSADYTATGVNDQDIINQAIASVGSQGGGTVLLLGGTYNISNNVVITYNNITLSGVGWNTILRLAPNTLLDDAGLLRSSYSSSAANAATPFFSGQHFKHMALDGNRANGTSFINSYANYGTYVDSSFENMRVHDFPHYGFDPHENSDAGAPTLRLTIKDSLADHNTVDGLTTDNCIDSLFTNNVLDSNGRHGINVVTASRGNTFSNNVSTNNGGNGITVQSGSDLSRTSDRNKLFNNTVSSNGLSGIYVYFAQSTEIRGNTITGNGRHGVQLRSATYSVVANNTINDNSQLADNKYMGIYLDNNTISYSTNNLVRDNTISSTATNKIRYGIAERSALDDYNVLGGNRVQGAVKGATDLKGLNSKILPEAQTPRSSFVATAAQPNAVDAGNNLQTALNLGFLTGRRTLIDTVNGNDPIDYYRFRLGRGAALSTFLNGLSSPHLDFQILSGTGAILRRSAGGLSEGKPIDSIRGNLGPGTYYLRVSRSSPTSPGSKYSLTLNPISWTGARTLAVAASNSVNAGDAQYFCDGTDDQLVINKAIADVAAQGGGTVLLLGGTYNVSNNVLIDGSNVTLSGEGWSSILRLTDNTVMSESGLVRAFDVSGVRVAGLTIDGNRLNQTNLRENKGLYGTFTDSVLEDLYARNCGDYGLDPHENTLTRAATVRLTIQFCRAENNEGDGITVDKLRQSTIRDNLAINNGRHGFNVVTESFNTTLINNTSVNNGSNGITVQTGSKSIRIINNTVRGNRGNGIYLYGSGYADLASPPLGFGGNFVERNFIAGNGRNGIQVRASSYNRIVGNTILNNSLISTDRYNGIYLDDDNKTFSTRNIVRNNGVRSTGAKKHRFGIAESEFKVNFNTFQGNVVQNAVRSNLRLRGRQSRVLP